MKTESSAASKTELPPRFRQFDQQYPAVMRAYEALGAAAQEAGTARPKDPRTRQARHRHRCAKRRRHPQPYPSRVGDWCHAGRNPSRRAARHHDSRLSGYDGRDDVGGRCPRCGVALENLKFGPSINRFRIPGRCGDAAENCRLAPGRLRGRSNWVRVPGHSTQSPNRIGGRCSRC